MKQHWIAIGGAALLMVAGCASSGDDLVTDSPASIEPSATAAPDPVQGPVATTDATASPADPSAETPSTDLVGPPLPAEAAVADGAQTYGDLGLDRIELLTFGPGLGFRPTLEWSPIAAAATYEVTVDVPGVGPYWAWSGPETAVPVGGYPLLEPLSAGPALTVPMTWRVVAIDSDGLIVGSSTIGEIAP